MPAESDSDTDQLDENGQLVKRTQALQDGPQTVYYSSYHGQIKCTSGHKMFDAANADQIATCDNCTQDIPMTDVKLQCTICHPNITICESCAQQKNDDNTYKSILPQKTLKDELPINSRKQDQSGSTTAPPLPQSAIPQKSGQPMENRGITDDDL